MPPPRADANDAVVRPSFYTFFRHCYCRDDEVHTQDSAARLSATGPAGRLRAAHCDRLDSAAPAGLECATDAPQPTSADQPSATAASERSGISIVRSIPRPVSTAASTAPSTRPKAPTTVAPRARSSERDLTCVAASSPSLSSGAWKLVVDPGALTKPQPPSAAHATSCGDQRNERAASSRAPAPQAATTSRSPTAMPAPWDWMNGRSIAWAR